ncbi:alpha-glucuronidase family glycosyl hydrolase [Aureibaculum luteum]|uniref:alpha-glucuronidase family glycosyl hydrolase n=1 Tax=Aureibaculum luteum TaxID=1548456 RepID=UPI000E48C66C
MENKASLNTYENTLNSISFTGNAAILNVAKEEIVRDLCGFLNHEYTISNTVASTNTLIIATKANIDSQFTQQLKNDFKNVVEKNYLKLRI